MEMARWAGILPVDVYLISGANYYERWTGKHKSSAQLTGNTCAQFQLQENLDDTSYCPGKDTLRSLYIV